MVIVARKRYLNKVSLEKAQDEYFSLFKENLMPAEAIEVNKARARVTAAPVYARRSAPHYYAAAMDGIAVRAEETAGASERNALQLQQGQQAQLIDTGDPVPGEFNAVIKIEEVNESQENGNQYFIIEKGATPWQHVRSIGESVIKGQLVLPVNHQIRSFDIGALLEAGITEVKVRQRPRIGIIPTGSEIISPEVEPEPGQLIDFNSSMLTADIENWGGRAHVTEIIDDDYREIKECLQEEQKQNEVTIIIAGSSAGEEDYTLKILQELGEVVVHGVNIMPGKPVILAVVDHKPVIGLPGYPLAALLNNYIFVRALIYLLYGLPVPQSPSITARIKRKLPSSIGLKEFLRVNLAKIDGELVAVPRKRGSAAMESLINADGVLTVPAQKEGLAPDSKAVVYPLKPIEEIKRNLLLTGSHDLTLDIVRNQLRQRRAGFDLKLQSVGSMAGLMALKRGECHLAGAHLLDEKSGKYNVSYINRILPDQEMVLINLVYRQQGLMVKPGNPEDIQKIEDLTRDDIIFINRQRGAGTRVLLDYWLKQKDIKPDDIRGYGREEYTHMGAAAAVANGSADAALGIMAAAGAMDLYFVPLVEEKYDVALPASMMTDTRVKQLLEILNSDSFKEQVEDLGGYSTENSGEIMAVK